MYFNQLQKSHNKYFSEVGHLLEDLHDQSTLQSQKISIQELAEKILDILKDEDDAYQRGLEEGSDPDRF